MKRINLVLDKDDCEKAKKKAYGELGYSSLSLLVRVLIKRFLKKK